jgi:hypothetical protein
MQLKFDLSLEMTNAIIEALGNTPYRTAAPVIAELQRQAQPQMQPQLVPQAEGEAKADDGAA